MSDLGVSAPTDDATDLAPDDTGDDAAQPTVICTITFDSKTGEFTLINDDEDDDDSDADSEDVEGADADAAGAGEGAEGMPPAAGGVAPMPKGQTFDSPGPLLKAVLDLLKEAEGSAGGSAEENFSAGFNGGSAPTPKSA